MQRAQLKDLVQTVLISLLVISLIRIGYAFRTSAMFAPYIPAFASAILLYFPLIFSRQPRETLALLDQRWVDCRRTLLWFGGTFLGIMPLFLIANHFWQAFVLHQVFRPRMLPHPMIVLLNQLILVAFPEEFFFRGWLQSRLNRAFVARWNIFGVSVGWGWLLTAVFFAFSHTLVHYQWWHFSIIFSALLFGWLREKTGTIGASTLWHGFGNITVHWIALSYS